MNVERQRTVGRRVSCAGIGLHSGRPVRMTLAPAAEDTGIRFVRTDAGGAVVEARADRVAGATYQTVLRQHGRQVATVEHLLATFAGLGIDNVVVELDHAEVPIMDGSAEPFVRLAREAGLRAQSEPRAYLRIVRPIEIARVGKRIGIFPCDRFRVSYSISFDHPLLHHQERTLDVDQTVFAEAIAPARTFTFLKDVEHLRRKGFAGGGSLDNAVVVGETGVLNQALRFEDEFVRHKMLDVIGDLALVGRPILGHVVVHRGGHDLHIAMAAKVLAERDAWERAVQPAAGERAAVAR